jgi:hypothetical protein
MKSAVGEIFKSNSHSIYLTTLYVLYLTSSIQIVASQGLLHRNWLGHISTISLSPASIFSPRPLVAPACLLLCNRKPSLRLEMQCLQIWHPNRPPGPVAHKLPTRPDEADKAPAGSHMFDAPLNLSVLTMLIRDDFHSPSRFSPPLQPQFLHF